MQAALLVTSLVRFTATEDASASVSVSVAVVGRERHAAADVVGKDVEAR
jgi:hypothetical protein